VRQFITNPTSIIWAALKLKKQADLIIVQLTSKRLFLMLESIIISMTN